MKAITTIEQVRLANLECLRHQIADRLAIEHNPNVAASLASVDAEIAEQRKVVHLERMAQMLVIGSGG